MHLDFEIEINAHVFIYLNIFFKDFMWSIVRESNVKKYTFFVQYLTLFFNVTTTYFYFPKKNFYNFFSNNNLSRNNISQKKRHF